jgi:DNA replication protein DnaC
VTADAALEAVRERYQDELERSRRATAERIPPRFEGATVTDPGVENWVQAVAASALAHAGPSGIPRAGRGPSLLLTGPTGTGKTRNAYGAMARLGELGVIADWRAVTAADLHAMLRPRHDADPEAEFRAIARAPVLIVDDLAAAKASEWTEEITYRIVNYRYEHEAVTLLTANVAPSRLPSLLGVRVASRLAEMTVPVALKGADRRVAR